MRTNIIIKTTIEGFHCWAEAREKLPEMSFLADRHRHMFHIEAKAKVDHSDRQIEIIQLKREIENYVERQYGKPAEFKSMSCEMIAQDLMEAFKLTYVAVTEDFENGAEVWSE